jgi:hypothetical protein
MMDETPYEELDPPIVNLCRAINALPGIWTISSCGGHEQGGSLPADEWNVSVQCEVEDDCRPSVDAWLSLEFLAWAVHDVGRDARLSMAVSSAPPWLNEPTRTIAFDIDGVRGEPDGIDPDHFADLLTRWTTETYLRPEGIYVYPGQDDLDETDD